MDEPTALLPPVSVSSLEAMLTEGPLELARGLALLAVIADHLAKLHVKGQSHGHLRPQWIRVSTFERGEPAVLLLEPESTRDMTEAGDLIGLGTLAFEVLVGRPPQPGETLSQARPDAPAAVEKLISRLMSPKASERLSAAGAHRQLLDLSQTALDPQSRAEAPLVERPQLKRGVAAPSPTTDEHAWVKPAQKNPFAEDEATARVTASRAAPRGENEATVATDEAALDAKTIRSVPLGGITADEEPTQYEPVKPAPKRRPPERHEPLPPPVPDLDPPEVTNPGLGDFAPSRSDLPPDTTGKPMPDPRMATRRRRSGSKESSPMSEFIRVAKTQPPWVWGAAGVGLTLLVLLLIALAR